MVINHQDPLNTPYKSPSRSRFLRGTVANKNINKVTAGFVAFVTVSGCAIMYFTPDREKFRRQADAYDEWRGVKNRRMEFNITPKRDCSEDVEVTRKKIQEISDPNYWRFWKPSFWLEPIKELYDPTDKIEGREEPPKLNF